MFIFAATLNVLLRVLVCGGCLAVMDMGPAKYGEEIPYLSWGSPT